MLGHTFGTNLIRGGIELARDPVDVVTVVELMGRADLTTHDATPYLPKPVRPPP
ncbi:hypothetical protein LG943_12655 [Streptomonospora sp. S1-112]|uniref:Uncharacterized protein n=1 Tax=Streptomonospora mangrovi TaxID=2883123 RepID=A0A9X3NJV5_9ACTN|nr:hypothetical protein [Streptomonospora mangrovi]MDA0565159.1 hypothetical protein [Streptomonospora mangrovi]